jgi:type VI secretion system secreted protein Hcp
MEVLILDLSSVGIKGECQLTDHVGMIELLSCDYGVARQITGDQSNIRRTSGKPNHQDMAVIKYQDLASSQLIDYCNQAKNIPTATLTVGQNDGGKVTKLSVCTLSNALVSSISVGGGGGGKPQETVTFNYTAISWKYFDQQSIATGSDIAHLV